MQNENVEKQSGKVRRNPSRDNKNINQQGQNNEKRFDNKTDPKRDAEINPSKLDRDEVDLDRSGVSDSAGGTVGDKGNRKSQQNFSGKNAGNEQARSQNFQKSRQEAPGVKKAAEYDPNEQFDEDEDFGSHSDEENSTRQ